MDENKLSVPNFDILNVYAIRKETYLNLPAPQLGIIKSQESVVADAIHKAASEGKQYCKVKLDLDPYIINMLEVKGFEVDSDDSDKTVDDMVIISWAWGNDLD